MTKNDKMNKRDRRTKGQKRQKDKRDRRTKETEGQKDRRIKTEGQKEIYYVYMILL